MPDFNTPWEGITAHLAERARIGENSARPADYLAMVVSSGLGEIVVEEMIDFGATFVQQPIGSYVGAHVDEEEGDELVTGWWPRCTGFVLDYHRNTRGHYLGAWVRVIVDIPQPYPDPLPVYAINHFFRFQGVAIKNVPADEDD